MEVYFIVMDNKKSPSELPFRSAPVADDLPISSTNQNIIPFLDCQVEKLSEHTELNNKFVPKKHKSNLLSDSFYRLGYLKKSERIFNCGSYLEFLHESENGKISETGKLHRANFCRERLCPCCSWRRTLKIFAQVSQIMESEKIKDKYQFLFLTLTIPSPDGEHLEKAIDDLMKSFHRLMMRKRVKQAIKGFFRVLEITYNKKEDTYHPHFHCILAVNASYFDDNRLYIKQSEWLDMWRECAKNPNILILDIRKVFNKNGDLKNGSDVSKDLKDLSSAVAEIAKYSVKDSDYIFENARQTDKLVSVLNKALRGRRLCQFGGILKQVHKELNLDDVEDGDLIHTNEDDISNTLQYLIVAYQWRCGVYVPVDSYFYKEGIRIRRKKTIIQLDSVKQEVNNNE